MRTKLYNDTNIYVHTDNEYYAGRDCERERERCIYAP